MGFDYSYLNWYLVGREEKTHFTSLHKHEIYNFQATILFNTVLNSFE